MHVLVTGGAGFIGSHLIKKLRKQNHDVDAIDNYSAGEASRRREKELEADEKVEVWNQDVDDMRMVLNMIKVRKNLKHKDPSPAVDAIVHLAAPISVEESVRNPLKYCNEIYGKTIHLLEAARLGNIRKMVIASTAAVYGSNDRLPTSEHARTEPLSPYAISKLAAEGIARMYAREHGIETAILRFFNVYGPDQNPSSGYSGVISNFMSQAKKKQQFTIFGDGKQTRDFVYVEDICDAIIAALTKKFEPGIVVNIGSGKETAILELAEKIAKVSGTAFKVEHKEPRKEDIPHSQASIERAKKLLDYEPKVSLEEGLKKTWDWFREYKG
ncbi:MAG: GDP-mannose 4,6-dehydratase [Candidatus Woesearchaeota archaeon]